MPIFFDSHCHFDFNDFDTDRTQLWQNCVDADIKKLFIPGVSQKNWPKLKRLAGENEGIVYGVGVHPWWVNSEPASQPLEQIMAEYLGDAKCVAIGETGLDGIKNENWAQQEKSFVSHLKLAKRLDLPVVIHSVKAHHHVLSHLQVFGPGRGVVHGFSGSTEIALQYWKLGYYLGVGGTITYERAIKTRKAVRHLPIDAILLETDAPDMPLAGRQGKRNSPFYVKEIAEQLAELRGEPVDEIATKTTENASRLFNC